MTTVHTATPFPLPVSADVHSTDDEINYLNDANGSEIATFYCDPEGKQAEFIVRACNTHDSLVAALKASEQCMADILDIYQNGAGLIVQDEAYKSLKNDGLKLARAALAKASA